MDLAMRLGEKVVIKGKALTVTPTDLVWLPRIRGHLIGVARAGQTITYGRVKAELGLPHAVNGLGRLLDLISEDCFRRGEPSLASLVVTRETGEVGDDYEGDPGREREVVYARWG